jgi:agmatine deiminase
MGWPGRDLVSTRLATAVKKDYALVARAIAEYEPVLMAARPGFGAEAAASCGDSVEVAELPLEQAWVRDCAPVFAWGDGGELVAIDFLFDGWGGVEHPDPNPPLGAALAALLGIGREVVPIVLEGGSFTVDGEGTLIAVEATVRGGGRNAGTSRTELEEAFRRYLGAERTIWLEHGLLEDETGGHADNVVAFVAPGRVLCQTVRDQDDPNHPRLAANRAVLEEARDARGRRLEIVDLDVLPYRSWAGRRIALSYLNLYIGNGCAIVPLALLPSDEEGLARIRDALPGREVVGVPATNLARRGGGPHCITQQVPSAAAG